MTSEEKDLLVLLSQQTNSKNSGTLERSLTDSINKIDDVANTSKPIKDAYSNSLLSIGGDDKAAAFTEYGLSSNTLNWPLWLALYNDSWVFKRAIDKPAQDMVRCGITLTGVSDKFDEVYRILKRHRTDFIQLIQWGALFGGSIACMMFDNIKDADYALPINYNKIRASKTMKMYVVDRWYGVAPSVDDLVTDMNDIDFGKPKYYNVTLGDGTMVKFHHSYVLRYEHRVAPKLIKNGQLQGWGYAEGSHIINELMRDDKLKSSIQSLVDKSLIEVVKMSGMRGVFMSSDTTNQEQLKKRLEMVNWARSFNSLTFLDKEDDYSQNTFGGLAGLSDLLQQNMWQIAAALEMQGVLFGDLKSGFSTDNDALERYDETINNRCEGFLRPIYQKFLQLLYKLQSIDEKVEFTFNSLIIKKQDKDKIDGFNMLVDLLSKLMNDGVISTTLYAKTLQNYAVNGVIDFGLTDEEIDKLKDTTKEEFENINLEEGM